MSTFYKTITGALHPIKTWTNHVAIDSESIEQLKNIANLPFIFKHVSAMPDVHVGKGATVGSVIPTVGAIIPAAVGVDIGCGMNAVRLSLKSYQLPDNLKHLRSKIEKKLPVGFQTHPDQGHVYKINHNFIKDLLPGFQSLYEKHDDLIKISKKPEKNMVKQLGTLGGGNHFIELCIDEKEDVWIMLHSGSRGIGNKIGQYFIELAKKDMEKHHMNLPNIDLAYLQEGTQHFNDYLIAVSWAQEYARLNRARMMDIVLTILKKELPDFSVTQEAINCHHNYIAFEKHFNQDVMVTRKGAVSAQNGELGIIPGSMGAKSFIVRGKGNKDSFCSCSHGAGRLMSRSKAKKTFSLNEHIESTKNVECRKDKGVIDETPNAYKNIDNVMESQTDLVDVVHTLKQVMCVKG